MVVFLGMGKATKASLCRLVADCPWRTSCGEAPTGRSMGCDAACLAAFSKTAGSNLRSDDDTTGTRKTLYLTTL